MYCVVWGGSGGGKVGPPANRGKQEGQAAKGQGQEACVWATGWGPGRPPGGSWREAGAPVLITATTS